MQFGYPYLIQLSFFKIQSNSDPALNCRIRLDCDPMSNEISDLCEISDLLLFLSYFACQSMRIKFGNYFLMCVVQIKHFG